MQLEQQESFEIKGPQLEVFGEAETRLPAAAKKRPAALAVLTVAIVASVLGIGGAQLKGQWRETGELITSLISELQGFDATAEQPKGFLGLFKKASNNLEQLKTRYESADKNVERIKAQLEDHQVTLMKDITMLDKMYELNLVYFKELTMYILAGKKKLEQVRNTDLKAAQEKAQRTQLPEDAQAARDLADLCDRFEKKLYDLELTRNVSIQMGPQIRLIQSNDTMMAEKIQTTIVNTIPLWKNQMVLALGIAHIQQDFSNQADAAASLIRIASAVVGTDDADLQAAQTALDNWNEAADRKDANEQYTLNRQLYTAVDTLYTAAADEADSKAKGQLTDLYDSFVSSQMILDRETAAYNQEADSYLKLASGFPGGVQAALWGVKDIPTFEP